jgi:two-component system, LytTR family, sensor kinase
LSDIYPRIIQMKITINKQRFKIYLRIGLAYLLVWLFIDAISHHDNYPKRVVNNIWFVSYLVIINFLLFEYVIPYIKLTWQRILIGFLLLWLFFILIAIGFYGWRELGIQMHIYFPLITHPSVMKGIEYHLPYSIFSLVFFGTIKYTYDYRKLKEAARQMRIEKQEAELNYLKSQTNPHFLFNTLNNIYSLARDKSDLAPESILRLSKILRFMLYETGGAFIAVEQEVKIITDYIALEKLRYDESLHLNFNYDIEDMKQALPPLLLIPLVENAFKHGVSETRGAPYVDIHLSIRQKQLSFVVKNSSETIEDQNIKENIGLSNLRRQMELLYKDYSLTVKQAGSEFKAILEINLSSHV